MIYPDLDKLQQWGSRYALVALAAKRAKQISSGAPILVDTQSKNPLTIALEEIAAGKIKCAVSDTDLPMPSTTEPNVAELLPIPDHEDSEEFEAEAVTTEHSDKEDIVEDLESEDDFEEEEEEEEDDTELVHEEIWEEVLHDEVDEDTAIEPDVEIDTDAEELTVLGEADHDTLSKPRRKRKTISDIDALVDDLSTDDVAVDSEFED